MRDIEKKKAYQHERYIMLKSRGICTSCASEDAIDGSVLCYACWERKFESIKPRDEAQKERDRKRSNELRTVRIRLRLCVACGAKLTDSDGTRCNICAKKHSKRRKPYAMTREQAIYKGICVKCRKEKALAGRKICGACLEYGRHMIELMNKAKEKKRNGNM